MAPNISALLATRAVHWSRNVTLFSSFLMISWAWLSSSQRGVRDCTRESNVLKSIQPKYSASDSNTDYVISADGSQISIILVDNEKKHWRPIINDIEILSVGCQVDLCRGSQRLLYLFLIPSFFTSQICHSFFCIYIFLLR